MTSWKQPVLTNRVKVKQGERSCGHLPTASGCHLEPRLGPSNMDGQRCRHPPCVATCAVLRGPVPAEYPQTNSSIHSVNLMLEADGFNFLEGQECPDLEVSRKVSMLLLFSAGCSY